MSTSFLRDQKASSCRTILSNVVVTTHTWWLKFKLIKIQFLNYDGHTWSAQEPPCWTARMWNIPTITESSIIQHCSWRNQVWSSETLRLSHGAQSSGSSSVTSWLACLQQTHPSRPHSFSIKSGQRLNEEMHEGLLSSDLRSWELWIQFLVISPLIPLKTQASQLALLQGADLVNSLAPRQSLTVYFLRDGISLDMAKSGPIKISLTRSRFGDLGSVSESLRGVETVTERSSWWWLHGGKSQSRGRQGDGERETQQTFREKQGEESPFRTLGIFVTPLSLCNKFSPLPSFPLSSS